MKIKNLGRRPKYFGGKIVQPGETAEVDEKLVDKADSGIQILDSKIKKKNKEVK